MRIDFPGLEAFVAIAERGSFNRAAAHLNLSQTALSHRMKKLEDDLGVRLLMRTTRQVTLTPAGLDLLPKAQAAIVGLTTSIDALRRQSRAKQQQIAIACLPTIAVAYLPAVLAAFAKKHRDVGVQVFDNSASEIADHVQSGRAEFGLTIVSSNRWDLDITPLMKEPFVLVCPQGHRLAGTGGIQWAELEGEPLVRISPQTGNRILIDDALGTRREALQWRYEVQHLATAVSIVRAGIALAIVPRLALGITATEGLVTVPLRNPAVTRTLGIVARHGVPPSRAAKALLDLIIRRLKTSATAETAS
jgi:DNA-binding transcriptional LysR family regulator